MTEKAFYLVVLLAAIAPGIPLFALLALAGLPWHVVISGTVAGWVAGIVALCNAWAGYDDDGDEEN